MGGCVTDRTDLWMSDYSAFLSWKLVWEVIQSEGQIIDVLE
jgi:hypothetical protein